MKGWFKTALLAVVVFSLLLVGISYAFNLRISRSSGDIEYAPGPPITRTEGRVYPTKPKNIILFIADGMGFGHLSLAMQTQQSEDVPSVWHQFDVKGWHDTKSTHGPLTDSGASATAIATGTATYWDVIGQDADGARLTNVFEVASDQGYATGIVTDSYIWDATPAAFVAHTESRDNARDILTQIASSELDLLFGELEDLGQGDNPDYESTMEILAGRFHLLDKSLTSHEVHSIDGPIAAIYDEDEVRDLSSNPNLTRLTDVALEYLASKNQPFVLLVECEEIDSGSHTNNSRRVIRGLQSIQSTLALILEFSNADTETLVVFTADHETGGLAAVANWDSYPNMRIRWSTTDHTAAVVPILATGPGAEHFASVERNWEIGEILTGLILDNER